MKFKTLFLAVSCLVISFTTADVTIPDISQLKGPLTNTPVPAAGNGTVTDPANAKFTTGTTSRLALYVPTTVYKDYPGWLAFYNALVFQGIPVTVTKDINVAKNFPTVVAYQSLQSKYMGLLDGMTWLSYVNSGKTLIAIGMTSSDLSLRTAFGLSGAPDSTTNSKTRMAIALKAPSASYPASSVNSMFDLTDVRDAQIPLWAENTDTGFPTIGYTIATGTFALGDYVLNSGSADTRKAITIKSTSNGGKAIAIGLDVGAYVGLSNGGKTQGIPRSYAAQYEPGYDNFFRLIKKLYETSTSTGLVTSWPVPGNKGVHFAWTYDIDAQDSYELAYDCAKDLQQRGMKGTINWQAKLVKDAYDIASFSHYYRNISMVEALGNMELSSHSVSHSANLLAFPVGTGKEIWTGTDYDEENYFPFIGECTNTTGTWTTNIPGATTCETPNESLYFYTVGGSLLGEARVSKFILEAISINNSKVRSFRTGHLLYPDALPQVLQAAGYKYSSSGASNDQNTHMPYQTFYNQAYNQAVDIIEFPLSASDEDGQINGDWAAPGSGGYPNGSYAYQQYQIIQKLVKYGGQYTFLIHPTSRILPNLPATLFSDKLSFQQVLAEKVKDIAYFDTMGGRGDFHNARIASGIDVSINAATSTATVKVTLPQSITDLTLRVPTAWAFASSTTAVTATPGAVVLLNTVAAGTVTLTFKTSGTVASPSAPAPGPATTTTTIAMSTPTVPAPTPAPNNPRVVDDFSDPQRYSSEKNALGFYTSDDNTSSARDSVQADWLLLSVTPSSIWYTLLGAPTTCNDYSAFTKLSLAIRYPTTTRVGFNVVLQDAAAGGCTGQTMHSFAATTMIKAAVAGSDGWLHLDIPLTSFGNLDKTRMRAVMLNTFAASGQVEIDYVYFS
ncbi:hypothetical protein BGZ75_003551 [Mortierella antarctica]|nr:hypothetical protein BGZ67_004157 [Mortierella alpina]KAF9984893.1 hypothetical protein BGZ75_003551 [Mortierella antarctica]